MGDAEHCADYLRKSLDEGYKDSPGKDRSGLQEGP